jgi:hypothetical protein
MLPTQGIMHIPAISSVNDRARSRSGTHCRGSRRTALRYEPESSAALPCSTARAGGEVTRQGAN